MRRRDLIKVIGVVAGTWLLAARAQPALPVIGVLTPESPTSADINGFRTGLRELGYVEGQNIRVEYRFAHGDFDRLPVFAADLVRLKVDLIVALVTQASVAAKKATSTIPIVMVGVADPIGVGLIASLDRPGGNVTGTSSIATDLVGKQLGILKEIIPKVTRVAAVWNPANPVFQAQQMREMHAAALKLDLQLQLLQARTPDEFEPALAAVEGTRAIFVMIDPLFVAHSKELAALSVERGLIAMSGYRTFAEAGGLLSYGPDYFDIYKRTALYVDKILKGARPGDLPVEQPTKFQFVINLKTAKALGVTIPPALLAIADEVIE
jgi:putative ABC transport system substrate-binding protein